MGFSDRFEMLAYSADGSLRRIIRRAWTPVPVDQASRERYLARYSGPDASPVMPDVGRMTTFAETHPPFDRLLADAEGNVWARTLTPESMAAGTNPLERLAADARWSIFDSSGVWLGELDAPAGFDVMDIGPDRVAGVWRDPDGISHVRLYRLIKP